MRHNRSLLLRAAALLLLFAVAGLSAVAKYGQYLPKSDPLHRISKTAKMELLHQPVNFIPALTYLGSRIAPPRLEFGAALPIPSENLTLSQNGLTTSFQHRAPPSLLP
jgi:hypothetical protein